MNKPLFTFDDGNASDLWAANILREHGLVGAFFLNDTPDLAYQIKALMEMGMIVGNHTATHPRLSTCNPQELFTEIVQFNEKMKSLGATGDWFSYPFSDRPVQGIYVYENFKYIFKGYDSPEPDNGQELSRVSVMDGFNFKPEAKMIEYLKQGCPLQLHGIESGRYFDMKRDMFIRLVKSIATPKE